MIDSSSSVQSLFRPKDTLVFNATDYLTVTLIYCVFDSDQYLARIHPFVVWVSKTLGWHSA